MEKAPLSALSAVARYGPIPVVGENGDTKTIRGLTILISDRPNSCTSMYRLGATSLSIDLQDAAAGMIYKVVAPSTVSAAAQATAHFDAVDQKCAARVARVATTGTVTIKKVIVSVVGDEDSRVAGSFDLQFADEHLTGDFDSIDCSGIAAKSDETNGITCAP